jgi:OmpA-OmpF porin, OOP family
MSFNLLDIVKGYFGNDLISKASSFLGESEGGVAKAVSGIVPSILGGLLSKSSSGEGASSIFNMAKEAHGSGILGGLGNFFGDEGGGLLSKGADLLKGLFGDKAHGLAEGVASMAGIKSSSASSLMSMAAPVALGALGKHASENNLDAGGLGSFLSSQKDSILGSLPASLGSLLGMGGLGQLGNKVANMADNATSGAKETISTASAYAEDAAAKGGGAIKWLLPLLLLVLAAAAAWYLMRGCNSGKAGGGHGDDTIKVNTNAGGDTIKTTAAAVAGKLDSLGNFIYDIGKNITIDLPNGAGKLEVGENSTEAKLYKMLSSADWKVDTINKGTGWTTLDRVYFETGKSTLTAASEAQLKNIGMLMKAFPTATMKIGGYTDNTGAADVNKRISGERATIVMKKLVAMGIAAGSLAAEGYGPEHPVCAANDTPECKAQNRRVDVRITKK